MLSCDFAQNTLALTLVSLIRGLGPLKLVYDSKSQASVPKCLLIAIALFIILTALSMIMTYISKLTGYLREPKNGKMSFLNQLQEGVLVMNYPETNKIDFALESAQKLLGW